MMTPAILVHMIAKAFTEKALGCITGSAGATCVCVCVCVCVCRCDVCGNFSICLPPAPPVHPAVTGYMAFAGVQIQGNGPGGTLGAHTTCCEERSVLLRVHSPAPGALLARLTVPA